MEKLAFQPGILIEVFDALRLKVCGMQDDERLCCLTLDEMSLTAKLDFDASTGDIIGDVTLPEHSGRADHALVFMLGGLTTQWKQTVAYHFTSSSTDGTVFKQIVLQIIEQASNIGLHVQAVASDMGRANRAMWKSFGIMCGKYCRTIDRIAHPQAPGKWLFFLADVPHVFKNVKAALVNGQNFTVSDTTVSDHELKSNVINVKTLRYLAQFQEHLDLKVGPNAHHSGTHT